MLPDTHVIALIIRLLPKSDKSAYWTLVQWSLSPFAKMLDVRDGSRFERNWLFQLTVGRQRLFAPYANRWRSVDDLVDILRGKIDDPREFFERAMTCRWHYEDRSDVVRP
jgi:hypothetical protein